MDTIPAKRCTKCGRDLPPTEFYVKVKATGRLFTHCKACHGAMATDWRQEHRQEHAALTRRWQSEHPERVATSQQRHRDTHRAEINARERERNATPEAKAKKAAYRAAKTAERKAYNAAYREAHREEIRAKSRAYYAANKEACGERVRKSIAAKPELHAETCRTWKAANKDAVNASTHKRRATIKGNGGHWTAAEWQAIKAAQDYRCLLCGRREPEIVLCFDHIIPVSLGGPNTAANGQGLCRSCNSKKYRKILDLRKGA